MKTILVAKTGKTTYLSLGDKEEQIHKVARKLVTPHILKEKVKAFDVKEGKLTEDEWFGLPVLGEDEQLITPYIEAALLPVDDKRIEELDLGQVRALALVTTDGVARESTIVVSKVTKANIFDRKTLLEFGVHGVSVEERTRGIELPNEVHAYYKDGKLFFKSFAYFAALFAGADKFYREATDDEVNKFCSLEMFLLGEEFDANTIGRRQRKQIALSLPLLPDFSDDDVRQNLANYAREYLMPEDVERMVHGDRFSIDTLKDLGYVFHLVFGDYYTHGLTGEKMIARRSEKLVG
jgi:hypothetical protein